MVTPVSFDRMALSILRLAPFLLVTMQLPALLAQSPALTPQQQERLKERDGYSKLATQRQKEGKYADAVQAVEKMLAIEREVLGNEHKDVVQSLKLLADLHEILGSFERAIVC